MLRNLSLAMAIVVLAACSAAPQVQKGEVVESGDGKVTTRSDYSVYLEKQTEQRPLFELTCPASGCVLSGLKVLNPNTPNIAPPIPEKGIGMAIVEGGFSLLGDAIKVGVPWAAGAHVLGKAFDKANSSTTNTTTLAPNTTTLTNTNTTTSTLNTTNTTTSTTNSASTQTNTNSNGNANSNSK